MSDIPPPVLAPTVFRTTTGILMMGGLAVLLLRTALHQGFATQAVMVAGGLAALALAFAMWRGRGDSLRWTDRGLMDGAGQLIAARDQIVAVDRNPMALKPSNGFTLRMAVSQSRTWQPGLYWRIGRRVGVGGLTSPGVAKALADRIALETAPAIV
ncbi:hypothetical protein ACOI1H_18105 [Loktanella sp. DJP18]|uniref:hypothetical protein n=1 Tax=Loktanella sp. DJP18 TaxID=3409788 RepID=UPI003BB51D27